MLPRLRQAALAAAWCCLSSPALASYNGANSASFRSPYMSVDSVGTTSSSSSYKLRDAGGVPVEGRPRALSVSSGSFKVFGGYLLRRPTATPTASSTITASPTSTQTATRTSTYTRTSTSTSTASPTASPSGTPSDTRTATLTATPSATGSPTRSPSQTRTASPSPTDTLTASPTPPVAPPATGNGLCGQYFNDITLTNLVAFRTDGPINFDWVKGNPISGIPSDDFSVRWVGEFEPPATDTYTFYTKSDDGVRLYVDNVLVIDDWNLHDNSNEISSTASALTAGLKVPIVLEYYEHQVNASVRLSYKSASYVSKAVLPANRLYSSNCAYSPTASPSSSSTKTASPSPTSTPTPTASPTAYVQLSLLKSADVASVTSAGDTITYVLSVANAGALDAAALQVWDSLPAGSAWLAGGAFDPAAGLVSFTAALLTAGSSMDFTFSVSYVAGASVDNLFSAASSGVAPVNSNLVQVALGAAFTPTVSPTPSSTASQTRTASQTLSASPSSTDSPTDTASPTVTISPTYTATETLVAETDTVTATVSPTDSPSPSDTASPTYTDSETATLSASATASPTASETQTLTPTYTASLTATVTVTDSPSQTVSPTETVSDSPSPSVTDSPTATLTLTPSVSLTTSSSYTASSTVSATLTPSPTTTLSFSHSPTSTLSFSRTPTVTVSPTITPTSTATPSSTHSRTVTSTRTATPTSTPTAFAPALSLAITGINSAYETEQVLLHLQIDNGSGGDTAQSVMLTVDLPAGLRFAGPGFMQWQGYAMNDQWHQGVGSNSVARGPFTIAPGSSVSVDLLVEIRTGTAGGTQTLTGSLTAQLAGAAGSSFGISVIPGVAPTRTETPSFTSSPTALGTYTITRTMTRTSSASPTPTQSRTFTASPTPNINFNVSLVLDTDPNLAYVGRDVSFTVSVSNALGAPLAHLVELRFNRDLPDNANSDVSTGFLPRVAPASLFYYDALLWYWQNYDNRPASPWQWVQQTLVGDGHAESNGIAFKLLPGAAGTTVRSQVDLYVNSVYTGQSAAVTMVVPLFTPTSNITDTPTITPTPIAHTGEIVAYPQPATDHVCFQYAAPAGSGGGFELLIYNLAFQLVGTIQDQAASGSTQNSCVSIKGLAPGLYLYRARLGEFRFPPGRFGVAR